VEKLLKRSSEMLPFLSQEDKDMFLSELIDAVSISMKEQNLDAAMVCLEKWEDTVELLSIPGLKDCAWDQFNKLKEAGYIN